MYTEKIVDSLLEGEELSKLLSNPQKVNLIGKKVGGCDCPHCQEPTSLIIIDVNSEDQNFYNVTTKCISCNELTDLELVLRDESELEVQGEEISFEGRAFFPCTEGLMNGNYLKFNNNVKAFITKGDNGDNMISFEEPEDTTEVKPLNNRVTFKVISFRNGLAKLISMVNDNLSKLPAGTLFFADKLDLQKFAKVSAPKQNGTMAGRFNY